MSKLLWLIGGTTLALAVYAILNGSELAPADHAELTAGKVAGWGTKQRVAGAGGNILGKVEEIAGSLTGNQDTRDQGVVDQVGGNVRNAIGQVAQAAGETIHDLNR